MSWETYSSERYVQRREDTGDISYYIEDLTNRSPRVVSIVAPPGAGKSWFMHQLCEKLHKRQLVLWVDVATIVDGAGLLRLQNLWEWIRQSEELGRQFCPGLPVTAGGPKGIEKACASISEQLCQCGNLKHKPLIFVDGYDEFAEGMLHELEQRVLDKLLAGDCIMLIVGRRNKLSSPYLRSREEVIELDVFDDLGKGRGRKRSSQPEGQFSGLQRTHFPASACTFSEMRSKQQIKHYRWNHPYLNAFLFHLFLSQEAEQAGQPYLFAADDLRRCCMALINRPQAENGPPNRHPAITGEKFALLLKMAVKLRESWTREDFNRGLGSSQPEDSDESDPIDFLIRCSAIENHKQYLQRYYIRPGLRELLLDIALMEEIDS